MLQNNCKQALFCIAMLFAFASPAFAQDDAQWCRNGLFDTQPIITPMRIVAADRTYLRWDSGMSAGCPAADTCRHGYLIAGQAVLAGARAGEFVCVYYAPSGTAGFAPASALAPMPSPPATSLRDWAGHWSIDRDEDAVIDIDVHRDALAAEGESYWPGRRQPSHSGEFAAEAAPRDGQLTLSDETCQLSLRRIGAYLVVSDNARCGGANVRFNGVYTRR